MNRIFITGISGLLGTNLSNDLIKNGAKVKGLVRDASKFKGTPHSNLELIQGSLFDDFTSVFSTIDCVVHIAAVTDQNLPRYTHYRNINCNATAHLFHTAVKCRVKRFIFVSTANTLGYGTLNDPGNEQKAIQPPFTASFYAKSKLEAEHQVLNNTHKIAAMIIHPTFMLGAYDTKPSSGKIILMCWKKKIVFYPPGGKNFVHVADVSKGIINSMSKGENGEKYLLANENLSYGDFFKKVNTLTHQNPFMVKVPKSVLMVLGFMGDLLRFLKIKTNLSSVNMKALCTNTYFSNEKSRIKLGITYNPVDKAITDAVNYFTGVQSTKTL